MKSLKELEIEKVKRQTEEYLGLLKMMSLEKNMK